MMKLTIQTLFPGVHHLSFAAKRLIYEEIIKGESNGTVRKTLEDAGYSSVSDRILMRYRCRPFVLRAVAAREDAALFTGAARFDERMRALTRSAVLLERMLHTPVDAGAPPARAGSEPTAISRELRGVLAEIDAQTHRREMRRAALEKRRSAKDDGNGDSVAGVLLLPDNERVPDIPSRFDRD